MRAKPLSPLSFSNSNYPKLLLILLTLLIAVTLVSATVFVYYPVSITTNWVDPPVRFQNPGTSGVSVALSNDNTTAVVNVATSRDLVLDTRHAFIYDDFNTNPFTTGRVTVLGSCDPGYRWDSANQYVVFNASRGASSGWNIDHMVAYYSNEANKTPSGATNVYVLMRTMRTRRGGGNAASWKGFFLFQSVNDRYYYTYEFRDSFCPPSDRFMTIVKCEPGSATRLVTGGRYDDGGWFIQWGVRNRSTGSMTFTTYDSSGGNPQTISVTDNSYAGAPVWVGFGGGLASGGVYYFDDFIACADADPRFVNVTQLTPGWSVRLEGSNGAGLTPWVTVGAEGVASLNVISNPIVRNGFLHVRYANGSDVVRKQFPVIVGGDVYRCISVLTDRSLLAYCNFDTKSYNVYLKLESRSITGTVYFLNLWIGSGTGTTPIQIVNNNVETDTTSTIPLGSSDTNYIHGNAVLARSSTVVLTLSFHYYIPSSEVEVEYPVTVTIYG